MYYVYTHWNGDTAQQFNIYVHWTLWLCRETPILAPNDSDPLGLRIYIQGKELVGLYEPVENQHDKP